VKRPSFGTLGRDLAIYVNSFQTTIPESVIHHYDGKHIHSLQLVVNF
jgi:eukaryotic translation initiation factor 2C